jgi:uroporphyrinogen-III decarboxylase
MSLQYAARREAIQAFPGGARDPRTLAFVAPAEVAREARDNLEIFTRGGGYVFAPVHNIQAQVPPANIVALFAVARDFPVSG